MWTERLSALPELAPLPGQADAALRLVHVRRRRSAVVVASTAGAVALVSLFLSASGHGVAIVEPASPDVTQSASGPPAAAVVRAAASASAAGVQRFSATAVPSRARVTAATARVVSPAPEVPAVTASPRPRAPGARGLARELEDCVNDMRACPVLSPSPVPADAAPAPPRP